jgi:hypothetical protein
MDNSVGGQGVHNESVAKGMEDLDLIQVLAAHPEFRQ